MTIMDKKWTRKRLDWDKIGLGWVKKETRKGQERKKKGTRNEQKRYKKVEESSQKEHDTYKNRIRTDQIGTRKGQEWDIRQF